ncbi:MAG: hypothetical protein O7G87_15200 [bacterium]|nr:hypothetical protein [bacterium]
MRNKETVDVQKLSNCRNQKFAAAEEIPPVALYRGKPFTRALSRSGCGPATCLLQSIV